MFLSMCLKIGKRALCFQLPVSRIAWRSGTVRGWVEVCPLRGSGSWRREDQELGNSVTVRGMVCLRVRLCERLRARAMML